MPRTKGSKNHHKSDFASQIAEMRSLIQTLTAEVKAIQKGYRRKEGRLES